MANLRGLVQVINSLRKLTGGLENLVEEIGREQRSSNMSMDTSTSVSREFGAGENPGVSGSAGAGVSADAGAGGGGGISASTSTSGNVINNAQGTSTHEHSKRCSSGQENNNKGPKHGEITTEEVRTALALKLLNGNEVEVKKILKKYGANKLKEVDKTHYSKLMKDVEKL